MTLNTGVDPNSLPILVAEDNPINQRVAQLMLHRLGQQVDVVGNGVQAVEAVKSKTYGVVFMDIQMPEMDGLEATRRILQHCGASARPYIIALTASEDRSVCDAAGMDEYLMKPLRMSDLADMLGEAVETAATWRRTQSAP